VYGNECLQRTAVFDWCKRFKEGRSSTEDLACPGCPLHVTDTDTHAKEDKMVQCDCRVMLRHISEHPGISMEHVHRIVMQVLGYWKVSVVRVLRSLNNEQKVTHTGICLEHLLWCERKGEEFLDHIVTRDKSWCLHYNLETERMSQQWKYVSSPQPKESCHTQRW
jgi:hypothetical protein